MGDLFQKLREKKQKEQLEETKDVQQVHVLVNKNQIAATRQCETENVQQACLFIS